MVKTRRVWYKNYLLTQFRIGKKWYTVPMGSKGDAPKMPAPDAELGDLNKQWLRLAIAEATKGPSEFDASIEELARLALEQQKKLLTEGPPPIPEKWRETIGKSFDVARGDVSRDIGKSFTDFLSTARRELIGRGLGEQGSSYLTDTAGFAAKEQGQLIEQAFSRLAAGQASAELSGSTDLAEMISQALNLSTGRISEEANRKLGLIGGGMQSASSFLNNDASRRLQFALSSPTGGMFDIGGGLGSAASGAMMGGMMGAAVPIIGPAIGAVGGGLAGLLSGGLRRRG